MVMIFLVDPYVSEVLEKLCTQGASTRVWIDNHLLCEGKRASKERYSLTKGKGKIDHKHFTLINQILFNVHKDAFCKRQGSKDVIIYRWCLGVNLWLNA